MFKILPKILAHKSSIKNGNFVTPEYIISDNNKLLRRYCPHRSYPLGDIGSSIDNDITCNFHGYNWTKEGIPTNNNRQLYCGSYEIGNSGLIFKDFEEPNSFWVDDIKNESLLEYSHTTVGHSKGSWLWMMEIQADLLHIRKGNNSIHPELSKVTDLDDITMHEGNGWILQTCSTGWWLFVYPFTFIEWSPGCLSINYTIPNSIDNEFEFSWVTQFYYDPKVTKEKRKNFETLEDIFLEDVAAIEKQKEKWFPLVQSSSKLEDHCVHFGKWVKENLNLT